MTAPRVFISYRREDRLVVEEVVAALTNAGVDVWFDQKDIARGEDWVEAIERGLKGCSVYFILAGKSMDGWAKTEYHIALIQSEKTGHPVIPLLLPGVAPNDLPVLLQVHHAVQLPDNINDFDWAELARDVCGEAYRELRPLNRKHVKLFFPGLNPYGEDDAASFWGRRTETAAMLERLGVGHDGVFRRWLQVDGPSGVGKSSIVRAGLIPNIRGGGWLAKPQEALERDWDCVVVSPGTGLGENIAARLERILPNEAALVQRIDAVRAGRDEHALSYLLKSALPDGRGLLLVIDQLEELFTLGEEGRHSTDSNGANGVLHAVDAMLADAVTDPDVPLYLVTTIRSDFLGRFFELPQLHALLNGPKVDQFSLNPVTDAGLTEIVTRKVSDAGLEWGDDRLPADIVKEAGDSNVAALPLVSNLLNLLWERCRGRGDHVFSRQDYSALDGVAGALSSQADALLKSLGRDGRERARQILLQLVHVKPGRGHQFTKRPRRKSEVLQKAGGDAEVLDRLAGSKDESAWSYPRLVVIHEGQPGHEDATVELAHELLLQENRRKGGRPYWPTLRRWVEDHSSTLQEIQDLNGIVNGWIALGRPKFTALADRHTRKRFRLLISNPDEDQQAFLRAGQRRSLAIIAGATFMITFFVVGATSWFLSAVYDLNLDMQVAGVRAAIGWYPTPEMVVAPSGSFTRQDDENGQEVHTKAFAIGKYEITFAQYDVYVFAASKQHGTPGECTEFPEDDDNGRGHRPVGNISWNCAKAYTTWLARETGRQFRLPSEAEWEYAARAGTTTRFWWSNAAPNGNAVCYDCGSEWDRVMAAPVGQFPPNPWELHDTVGNVAEWVEDCWHDDYGNAPTDGSAWQENGDACDRRVFRGGAYISDAFLVEAGARDAQAPDFSASYTGFRVAEDIDGSSTIARLGQNGGSF